MSDVEIVRVPGLRGPVHDWLVIPAWLHQQMHDENFDHEHKPDTAEESV